MGGGGGGELMDKGHPGVNRGIFSLISGCKMRMWRADPDGE